MLLFNVAQSLRGPQKSLIVTLKWVGIELIKIYIISSHVLIFENCKIVVYHSTLLSISY